MEPTKISHALSVPNSSCPILNNVDKKEKIGEHVIIKWHRLNLMLVLLIIAIHVIVVQIDIAFVTIFTHFVSCHGTLDE